jgi:hypothetical protein
MTKAIEITKAALLELRHTVVFLISTTFDHRSVKFQLSCTVYAMRVNPSHQYTSLGG